MPACTGVDECLTRTEAAIAARDYEAAHDLAWRTMQQGTRNDPALMFLLARTQALSRRPDDALVMLRRLTELGESPDASGDEFRGVRELEAWPAVEALIDQVRNRPPDPLPSRDGIRVTRIPSARAVRPIVPDVPVAAPVIEAPSAPKAPLAPTTVTDAGSFSSAMFAPAGLACDAASGRYVLGDRLGRKIQILAEGADHAVDLTSAVSAGFLDIAALDIDTTNGTLWVASGDADGQSTTLHRLQLISGRSLATHRMKDGVASARPIDVAVIAGGAVLVLDTSGRVLVHRAGAAIDVLASLTVEAPTSLAVHGPDVAYVAHRDGLARINLRTGSATPVPAPKSVRIDGIERLRRFGSGLIGVQSALDGTRRLVRLTLDGSGRVVLALTAFDVPLPSGPAPIAAAVCGDTVAMLFGGGETDSSWTMRRIRLGK